MPELPEVEIIRLGLQKYLIGHKILDIDIKNEKTFYGNPKDVIGSKVINIERLGKGLIIELDNGFSLAIHLKMTGQIIYRKVSKVSEVSIPIESGSKVSKGDSEGRLSKKVGGELPNKFTRVIFKLKSQNAKVKSTNQIRLNRIQKSKVRYDSYLYFNDIRKFGWIKIIESGKLKVENYFKGLGPEPPIGKVSKVSNVSKVSKGELTLEKFKDIVTGSNRPIKIVLMDQKRIAGVGNIYANEGLFRAGIDPGRKSSSLSQKEIEKLYLSIIEVLKRGIKYGGSSDVNFVNAIGEDGHYQEHFLAYGRKGQKCKNCGGIVQKIVIGGRGTYFCPKCQK